MCVQCMHGYVHMDRMKLQHELNPCHDLVQPTGGDLSEREQLEWTLRYYMTSLDVDKGDQEKLRSYLTSSM